MATRSTAAKKSTRSKAETKAAFTTIRDTVDSSESLDRVSGEIVRADRARVSAATSGLTVETAVQRVTQVGLDVQRAFSAVQEQLVARTQELADLQQSIEYAKEDLQKLHDLDVAAVSIEHLVQEYSEKEASLKDEVKTLEMDIKARRDTWAKEQKEYEGSTQLQRHRELENYNYGEKIRRRNSEESFEREISEKRRQADLALRAQQEDFDQRDAELKKQESFVIELKKQVEEFPITLKKEKEAAVSVAVNTRVKDLTQDFALKEKDLNNLLAIANAALAQANKDKDALASQITILTQKLESAQNKVVEVASKAVESASGQLAMAKVQEFAATANGNNGRTKQ